MVVAKLIIYFEPGSPIHSDLSPNIVCPKEWPESLLLTKYQDVECLRSCLAR